MGLDMYLWKETYVNTYTEDEENFQKCEAKVDGHKFEFKKIKSIVEEFAYWRKANQIHKWFVDNIQNGVDDCGKYSVEKEDLIKLYDTCVEARLKKDKSILPPTEGFFFGSTDTDEYYWREITDTIRVLKPLVDRLKAFMQIKEEHPDDWKNFIDDEMFQEVWADYYYESSW
jgi:hypothetical protein